MNAFGSGQSPNSEFFSPSMTLFSNLILNDDLRSLQADDKKNICFSAHICKWSCKRSRFIILIGKPPSCQCFVQIQSLCFHQGYYNGKYLWRKPLTNLFGNIWLAWHLADNIPQCSRDHQVSSCS
jgi:hypothetical protein